MSEKKPMTGREKVLEIAPDFIELGDRVLFGEIWERPQLSKRDRSLVTCAACVAGGWTEQMKTHFPKAIQNGVTKEELYEMLTHLAFYTGWPSASTAFLMAREIFNAEKN